MQRRPRHYYLRDRLALPWPDDDDFEGWARAVWGRDVDRHVAYDVLQLGRVSTVFLGLDHNYRDEGDPLLFETMIFLDGWDGEYCERYSTWQEAVEGHRRALEVARDAERGLLVKLEEQS